MKTLAAILEQLGQPLRIRELTIPDLKPGQVLVDVAYSGVCHSQLHEVRGMRGHDRFLPHTLGHEGSGTVLDVGCGKGFMLHDFKELMPNLTIAGIDISDYGIEHAMETVKPFLRVGNARELPYEDNSFDLVISINTIHNLPLEECKQALREIQRVTRQHAFITVDAWRTEEEHERMMKWNLTALTYMHVDEWKRLFEEVGYQGDYLWFIAE